MGCKGSKDKQYRELNKNVQRHAMFHVGINYGETTYGFQMGLARTTKRDFTTTEYHCRTDVITEDGRNVNVENSE